MPTSHKSAQRICATLGTCAVVALSLGTAAAGAQVIPALPGANSLNAVATVVDNHDGTATLSVTNNTSGPVGCSIDLTIGANAQNGDWPRIMTGPAALKPHSTTNQTGKLPPGTYEAHADCSGTGSPAAYYWGELQTFVMMGPPLTHLPGFGGIPRIPHQ